MGLLKGSILGVFSIIFIPLSFGDNLRAKVKGFLPFKYDIYLLAKNFNIFH